MRNRFRESTAAILAALVRGSATCQDIAQACSLGITNTGSLLLRLYRMGHVTRERTREGDVVIDKEENISRPRYVYLYSLTPKGEVRLKFINSSRSKPRNR
jgi:predicted transcriptional regulator